MKKLLIISTVMAVVLFGGWFMMIGKPTEARINGRQGALFADKQKLKAYQTALASIDNLIKENKKIYAAINNANAGFSGENEVINLYQTLDSICNQPDYKLDEITPSLKEVIVFLREWKSAESKVYLPINIKIRSSYKNLTQLTKEIENNLYFHHLTECHIMASNEYYPDCLLNISFKAGLSNRLGLFGIE